MRKNMSQEIFNLVTKENVNTYDRTKNALKEMSIKEVVTTSSPTPANNNSASGKTKKVYVVQGDYGNGWEDLVSYDDYTEAQEDLKAYNENEKEYKHRVETRQQRETANESVKPSKRKLKEADNDEEDDEEFIPTDEFDNGEETPEADTEVTDDMTDDEYEEQAEDDDQDTIEDEIDEPFYATTPEFDELREVLEELDYRLFLINDNMVCIGRLNGTDIEFLTSNNDSIDEQKKSEENDKADEVEEKAEEDNEKSYEYLWVKAPDTLEQFLQQINVVYLSPDMSDEDKEQYAGIEASHNSVMEYLYNELPDDVKDEIEPSDEEEDTEIDDIDTEEEIDDETTEEETPKEDEEE